MTTRLYVQYEYEGILNIELEVLNWTAERKCMKVDLHLHSPLSIKNGDSINWPSDKEVISKIYKQNIKIAAFTDHNTFDKVFYIKQRDFAKTGGITLLPGIEVNVRRVNGEIGHVLVLFSETLSDSELFDIESIARTKIKKRGVNVQTLNTVFNKYNTIKIPHVGKGDYLAIEDLNKLVHDAHEVSNINHHNYKKVCKEISKATVAFSDTHIWRDFPQQDGIYTDLPIEQPTFEELKKVLKNNKDYTKEIFND